MNPKEPDRVLENDLAGFDLVPSVRQPFQPIKGQGGPFKSSKTFRSSRASAEAHSTCDPTTPVDRDRASPAAASCSRPRAAAQSPKRPKISPSAPTLVDERGNSRCCGGRGRRGENSRRRDRAPGPQHALSNETRQSSVLPAFLAAFDRLQTRDRPAPINNQHRLAALQAVDQRAQAVLGLCNTSSLHQV